MIPFDVREDAPGFFSIRSGERFMSRLTRDECLAAAASLIADGKVPPWWRTYEQHNAWLRFLDRLRKRRGLRPMHYCSPAALLTHAKP